NTPYIQNSCFALGEASLSCGRRGLHFGRGGSELQTAVGSASGDGGLRFGRRGGGARLWVVVGSERWGSKWRGLREAETAPTGTMRYSSSGGGGFKMRELRTAGLL
ncbi:hypothetical protein GUJ93_ZPchr0009g1175, partial [Zizania palustris]